MSANQEILVLQVQGEELRLVHTASSGATVELSHACSFHSGKKTDDGNPLRDENLLDALAEYVTQNGWIGKDLVCVIGGSSVACQHYDMPPLRGDALRQAVILKLGQQLHFEVAEAIIAIDGPAAPAEPGKPVRVSVSALHQEYAQAAVDVAARTGLNLKAVTVAPAALAALSREVLGETGGLRAVLYLDERAAALMVNNGPLPCVTAELPIGAADLTKALMRPIISGEDILQLDEEQAAALRNEVGIPSPDDRIESLGVSGDRVLPLIEPVLQQFAKHVIQWLTFASGGAGDASVEEVLLVGPGASIRGLAETLAFRLSMKVRTEDWLAGRAKWSGPVRGTSLDVFAPAVGAARSWSSLPDLMPPEIRRRRRRARIRDSVAVCGAVVAAAIAGFAVLFNHVASLTRSETWRERQLADVQQFVDVNTRSASEKKAVTDLQKQFDDFAAGTPSWVGVFKELSVLLPRDVQATGFEVRSSETGMRLVVTGAVYPTGASRSFDEVVEETLRLLQRSVFFDHVQLLTANRESSPEHPDALGVLSIELGLVYERPKA